MPVPAEVLSDSAFRAIGVSTGDSGPNSPWTIARLVRLFPVYDDGQLLLDIALVSCFYMKLSHHPRVAPTIVLVLTLDIT